MATSCFILVLMALLQNLTFSSAVSDCSNNCWTWAIDVTPCGTDADPVDCMCSNILNYHLFSVCNMQCEYDGLTPDQLCEGYSKRDVEGEAFVPSLIRMCEDGDLRNCYKPLPPSEVASSEIAGEDKRDAEPKDATTIPWMPTTLRTYGFATPLPVIYPSTTSAFTESSAELLTALDAELEDNTTIPFMPTTLRTFGGYSTPSTTSTCTDSLDKTPKSTESSSTLTTSTTISLLPTTAATFGAPPPGSPTRAPACTERHESPSCVLCLADGTPRTVSC
ncbi:hypothetical protein LTR37_016046 [Vermiconidia calcicola]|uniref:Uncharacterized protein n=1 Tax=Vermiconidia calcicola TaxID=1690605 RepID=A0ACC3MP23_9PEZI|nr:hypothetical protein LTR37_016046 [Vermiconidia calcicola]